MSPPDSQASKPRLDTSNLPKMAAPWVIFIAALTGLAIGLAWFSSGFQNLYGWLSFLVVLLIGGVFLLAGWRLVRAELPPRWLAALLLGAALLRLVLGVLWYTGLPAWGYDSPAEAAGYVMSDAYDRDMSAWELAQSEKPLVKAFQGGYRRYDQYGGLLFTSALVYRFIGGELHQPLLMVVLSAAFSSLAILFTWAFARRVWDHRVAGLTAWLLLLYPEAVLMGSSQMREAYTVTLVAAAFYGLACYLQDHSPKGLAWMVAALVLLLPFSPPFAGLLLLLLLLQAIITQPEVIWNQLRRKRQAGLILVVLAVVILLGVWLTWGSFAPEGISNPVELVSWWVKKSADWQAHLSERASGWVQKIFDSTPEWTHAPMLLAYGVVQPFLPAALSDATGAIIWRGIAIWRAVGWTFLLVFLVYAPVRAMRRIDKSAGGEKIRWVLGLSLVVWLGILIASYRGGGDQWDNPRYREAFAGLQVALAAWAWTSQRSRPDPWLRRALGAAVLILAWFLPWYLRRYIYLPWPVEDLFKTLGLGVASAVLYWIWDWANPPSTTQGQ